MSYELKHLKKSAKQLEELIKVTEENNRIREIFLKQLLELKLDKIDRIEMGEG